LCSDTQTGLFFKYFVALACLLLAGKLLDRAISLRRLIEMADKVPFSYTVRSGANIKLVEHGDPKKSLVKDYESHILMCGFGYTAPSYDHFSFVNEIDFISKQLDIDADATQIVKSTLNNVGFTHSSLSLLGDANIVVLGLYHYNYRLGLLELSSGWSEHFDDDDRMIAEHISFFMSKTATYVEHQRRQTEQYESNSPPNDPNQCEDILPPDFKQMLDAINGEVIL
jgi:hypothetical protein